jgi:hypothetical protein
LPNKHPKKQKATPARPTPPPPTTKTTIITITTQKTPSINGIPIEWVYYALTLVLGVVKRLEYYHSRVAIYLTIPNLWGRGKLLIHLLQWASKREGRKRQVGESRWPMTHFLVK